MDEVKLPMQNVLMIIIELENATHVFLQETYVQVQKIQQIQTPKL